MVSHIRNSRLLPALVLCLLCSSTIAAVPGRHLPAELSEKGYLRVEDEKGVRVKLDNPRDSFLVGMKYPLIQENLEYFVGLIEGEYAETRLFAVPRITSDNQGTAWVTQEKDLIFGVSAVSSRGVFHFRPGEWLTVLEEGEKDYTVLCTRNDRAFPIDIPKQTTGIEFYASLPDEVEDLVMERHLFARRPTHPSPVITDEYLREITAGEIFEPRQKRMGSQASTLAFAQPKPPPAPAVVPEARKEPDRITHRDTPEKRPAKASNWLMSNTSWGQPSEDDGTTSVITPDSLNPSLRVNDTDAVQDDGSNDDPPAATPVRGAEDDTPVEMAVAAETSPALPVADEPGPETEFADPAMLPSVETPPILDVVVEADVEPALDTATGEDIAAPFAVEAIETLETTAIGGLRDILIFVASVAVGALVMIMGLAWFLNRGKKRKQATVDTAEAQSAEQADEPAAAPAPPPLPENLVETPPELEEEFSKKMSFSGGVFTGSLDGLTVSQLIQFIHSVEESGSLSVTHGNGEKAGKIIFKRGEITDIQSEGLRGEEALREVIAFHDGIFAFSRRPVDSLPDTAIQEGTMSLLMNALKTLDEDQEAPAEVAVSEVS